LEIGINPRYCTSSGANTTKTSKLKRGKIRNCVQKKLKIVKISHKIKRLEVE
jgi:hypothetical protein